MKKSIFILTLLLAAIICVIIYNNKSNKGIVRPEITTASKTRFLYRAQGNDVVCCNIKTGEKELTIKIISGAEWTKKGDKIIYSIPKNGFESIKKNEVYKADFFKTYIYNLETKEKIKIADFYARVYCSPDDRYLILIPREFKTYETM